jgi:hypothetical protein
MFANILDIDPAKHNSIVYPQRYLYSREINWTLQLDPDIYLKLKI